jgi:hypothetical protein
VRPGDFAWPPARDRELIQRGGQFYTRDQLAEQERVEDAAAEWQRSHEREVGVWPPLEDWWW